MATTQFDSKAFGQRLRELRVQRGMTQAEASEQFQMSERQWQRIESGQCRPSVHLTADLGEFFGVTCDYLVFGSTIKNEVPEHILAKFDKVNSLVEELLRDLQELK